MTQNLTKALRADLDAMLSQAPELIEGMIEISYQRKWLETTFSAIKFSQCVVQALWYTSDPLLQIPHLTELEVKQIMKHYQDSGRVLWKFLATSDADKPGLANLTNEQKKMMSIKLVILSHASKLKLFYMLKKI